VLVVSENDYPGWRAYVDGQSVPIVRVNYNLRGVVVPQGEHEITFVSPVIGNDWWSRLSAMCDMLQLVANIFRQIEPKQKSYRDTNGMNPNLESSWLRRDTSRTSASVSSITR
jgi:hypothetical protein